VVLTTTGVFLYCERSSGLGVVVRDIVKTDRSESVRARIDTQKDLYPPNQLDHDPTKKTVVILGSGWGATSFLKSLDNEEYNVVSNGYPFAAITRE
jgi:hypothetical protein